MVVRHQLAAIKVSSPTCLDLREGILSSALSVPAQRERRPEQREEEQERRREQQQTRQTMVSVLSGLAKRLRPGFVVFVKAGGKLRQQVQNSPNLAEAF